MGRLLTNLLDLDRVRLEYQARHEAQIAEFIEEIAQGLNASPYWALARRKALREGSPLTGPDLKGSIT